MPDREKAIRILEGNYKNFVLRHNGELLTVNELIALLKAQEPVTVICSHDYTEGIIYRCPKCKDKVYKYNGNYCSHCGQAVKWG